MFCGKCGTQNPDNAAFCKKCGTQLNVQKKDSAPTTTQTPARVQPKPQHSHNTSNTPPARTDSPEGKLVSASSKRLPKKKSCNGVLRIGMLITLIVVLICIFMFVIRPLIDSELSGENNQNRQSSTAKFQNRNGSDAESSRGYFLSGEDNKTQTIYVVDGMSIKSQNNDYAMIYTYANQELKRVLKNSAT